MSNEGKKEKREGEGEENKIEESKRIHEHKQ
jgi:hypothetical protein